MDAARRWFLTRLPLALLSPSLAAEAQTPARPPKVGVLLHFQGSNVEDLRAGLRDIGYVEGQTVILEVRSAEARPDRLPGLATELVRLGVDVIVTSGPTGIAAARAATRTIPIVMGRMDDVDAHGFVTNLARPDGNVTGLSFQTGELAAKWVELIKDAVPGLSRLAVMWDATGTATQRETAHDAARAMGLHVQALDVRGAQDLDAAIESAKRRKAEALAILASPALTGDLAHLASLATRHRLPAIYYNDGFAAAGGLMTYGPKASDFSWRRAAIFIDKIVKGAKPADLPIEQPTKFELVINLKAARALGITVPRSLLVRADRVIE
jgi:putative tryptophan/tyrosine transport system substrate-binding protein